jgi:hypothetical protein
MDSWHSLDTLRSIKVLAVVGALAGMGGLIWYIFIAVYHHIRKFIAGMWRDKSAKYSLCPSNSI